MELIMGCENIIKEFLIENPKPSDEQIHHLAKALKKDYKHVEEEIYEMLSSRLKKEASQGGLINAASKLLRS